MSWISGLPVKPKEVDAVLVFGGDGTVHRHLTKLVELDLPVLIVPCGSGNDFARALGLRSVSASLAAWRKFHQDGDNVQAIDLGTITPLGSRDADEGTRATYYFSCIGGVGLDGEVARRANRLPRWLRAHGGYVLSLFPAIAGFAAIAMKISIGGARHFPLSEPVVVAAFANAPAYGGGMNIAPRARLDDGLLDVCIVRQMSKLKLLGLFPTIYFGRHLCFPQVEYFQTECLRVETETPIDVYADGEFVCQTPIEVGIAPRALRVITG